MKNKLIALIILTLSMTSFASTEQYKQNVEFTVMHGVGGVSDITSRYIANNLNSSYIVVNRPGAGGRIALRHLIKEDTMLLATMIQVFVTNTLNYTDLEYTPLVDLEVLAVVGVMPQVLICNKTTGIQTYNDFLNYNKSLSFGFGGVGSSEHIATEILIKETKSNSIMVPYAQGGNKAVTDLVGGHIDCMFANYPTIKPHLANKDLKIIMTSHELGYSVSTWGKHYKKEFPFQSYLSIIVPSKMNKDKKEQIITDLRTSFLKPAYKQGIASLGLFPILYTEKTNIDKVVKYMDQIQDFIISNNIITNGQ
jgi:tripartite-type tricarboxylate transporter receptor subunit TctC